MTPALVANPAYTVIFHNSSGCKDQGAGSFTNPIAAILYVNVPNAVSVYMDFSKNYGNGVGDPLPLEDSTTCQSSLPSHNGNKSKAPSATGYYSIDKNYHWVFTGGGLEGSCLTPSGPSPDPLPGGSGGGDKLKRSMKKGNSVWMILRSPSSAQGLGPRQ